MFVRVGLRIYRRSLPKAWTFVPCRRKSESSVLFRSMVRVSVKAMLMPLPTQAPGSLDDALGHAACLRTAVTESAMAVGVESRATPPT